MTLGLYIIVGIGGFLIGVGVSYAFGYYIIKRQRKNAQNDGVQLALRALRSPYQARQAANTVLDNDTVIIGDKMTTDVKKGLLEIYTRVVSHLKHDIEMRKGKENTNVAKTSSDILS